MRKRFGCERKDSDDGNKRGCDKEWTRRRDVEDGRDGEKKGRMKGEKG